MVASNNKTKKIILQLCTIKFKQSLSKEIMQKINLKFIKTLNTAESRDSYMNA